MGVYIKGMEMPTSCMLCPFCVEEADPSNGEMCMATGTLMPPCTRERLDNCPLISVPKHGRLIDADAVEKQIYYVANLDWNKKVGASGGMLAALEIVEDAPTIIPAEEGKT